MQMMFWSWQHLECHHTRSRKSQEDFVVWVFLRLKSLSLWLWWRQWWDSKMVKSFRRRMPALCQFWGWCTERVWDDVTSTYPIPLAFCCFQADCVSPDIWGQCGASFLTVGTTFRSWSWPRHPHWHGLHNGQQVRVQTLCQRYHGQVLWDVPWQESVGNKDKDVKTVPTVPSTRTKTRTQMGELDWGEGGGWVRRSVLCVREKHVCHL